MIWAVVPLAGWVVCWVLAYSYDAHARRSVLTAGVVIGLLVVGITEMLSACQALTPPCARGAWLLCCAGALCAVIARRSHLRWPHLRFTQWRTIDILIAAGIGIIVLVTLVTAMIAAPTTNDSLTYHLARVMHWAQNRSVGHYPTNIVRQCFNTAGAEYAVLQLWLLCGSDCMANLVQWSSMAGSLVGVSLIAGELGARMRGQLYSAAFAATLPMGILQASSTQTDYAVTFWLVCFVYFALYMRRTATWPAALTAGAALGLALFTKRTAYLVSLPFMVFLVASAARHWRSGLWMRVLACGAVAFALNAGYYARNMRTFGDPLGAGDARAADTATVHVSLGQRLYHHANLQFNLPLEAHLSSISKNIGLHIGTPWPRINTHIEDLYVRLNNVLGIDVHDATLTSVPWINKFNVRYIVEEDNCGNPLHFLVIVLALPLALLIPSLRKSRLFLCVYGMVWLAFLYIGYRGWTPFNVRYHLPCFVLWAACAGVWLERGMKPWLALVVLAALVLPVYPCVTRNWSRPLSGENSVLRVARSTYYYRAHPEYNTACATIAQFCAAQSIGTMGLFCDEVGKEYLLWVALRRYGAVPRVEHVNVSNPTRGIAPDTGAPEAIVVMHPALYNGWTSGEARYEPVWKHGPVVLLVKAELIADAQRRNDSFADWFARIADQKNMLKNGGFADGMAEWRYWQTGVTRTNDFNVAPCAAVPGARAAVHIANAARTLIGLQQTVALVSGTVYRISAYARSLTTVSSHALFGGRIGVYLPSQKEQSVIWMTETAGWHYKELEFENHVNGSAVVYVHLGYGNVATTGAFTAIRLERVTGDDYEKQ